MANTKSAKKAIRSSARKASHNSMWEKMIKDATKSLKAELEVKSPKAEDLNTRLTKLQKVLDKAAKEKVIHKNKANRIKSRYAKKITAYLSKTTSETQAPKPTRKPRKSAN